MELYKVLREVGASDESATAAAQSVVGSAELATRADLTALRSELRTEIAELRSELRTEIAKLRGELRTEIAELRLELRTEIAQVRVEVANTRTAMERLGRRIIMWNAGTVLGGMAIMAAMLRLL